MKIILVLVATLGASAFAGSGNFLIKKVGSGQGQVCIDIGMKTCPTDDSGSELGCVLNDRFTIMALPAKGSAFKGWAGACRGKSKKCKLHCAEGSDLTVFAKFARKGHKPHFKQEICKEKCLLMEKHSQLKSGTSVEDCVKALCEPQKKDRK